jgi:hypothetical protein
MKAGKPPKGAHRRPIKPSMITRRESLPNNSYHFLGERVKLVSLNKIAVQVLSNNSERQKESHSNYTKDEDNIHQR